MFFQKAIKRGLLLCALLAGGAGAASNSAQAVPFVVQGWSGITMAVTIDQGYKPITNIAVFTKTTTSGGYGRYFTANAGYNEHITAQIPPQGGLGISGFAAGVIAGLPSDPVGPAINHLVVFGAFSVPQLTMDFATLFPHISESAMINDLLTTPGNLPLPHADYQAFIGDANVAGLYGANGAAIKVVAFSTGTVIGSGNVIVTRPLAAPEPLTLAVFGTGLAGVAALRRRKRQVA